MEEPTTIQATEQTTNQEPTNQESTLHIPLRLRGGGNEDKGEYT